MTTPRIEELANSISEFEIVRKKAIQALTEAYDLGAMEATTIANEVIQKARHSEKQRIIEIIWDELRASPLEVQMTKGIVFANVIKRIQSDLDQPTMNQIPNIDFIKSQQKLVTKYKQKGSYSSQTKAGTCQAGFYTEEDVDTLIQQVITNTGEELLKRVEGERDNSIKDYPEATGQIAHNAALDTTKQHIINVTGAYDR